MKMKETQEEPDLSLILLPLKVNNGENKNNPEAVSVLLVPRTLHSETDQIFLKNEQPSSKLAVYIIEIIDIC